KKKLTFRGDKFHVIYICRFMMIILMLYSIIRKKKIYIYIYIYIYKIFFKIYNNFYIKKCYLN
ncbi:MAG: hypothetical protein MCS20_01775, partial [Candidatus Phytoplasma mali]|nr:hypothetical protein [Candidatus Phytoplasma australiense]MBZ7920114.1 hypothetical protein [Candidatus Karelsulcia muelleri]MCG7202121.1 hypothetical protein [Candidatus Phytoplasma mali]MCZ8632602.1 hypothetical protein [Spiroplasma sp. Tabriz.8]